MGTREAHARVLLASCRLALVRAERCSGDEDGLQGLVLGFRSAQKIECTLEWESVNGAMLERMSVSNEHAHAIVC